MGALTPMLPRYTVDLAAMHALYEWNYARLQKLLRGAGAHERIGMMSPLEYAWSPEMPATVADTAMTGEPAEGLLAGNGVQPVLQLARVERTRYTETWRLAQMTQTMPWCPELDMEVRIYHDARMADVLRFQTARRIPAIVPAAHAGGWRVNEKQLVNQFLGDCLQHCLSHGLPRDPVLRPDYSVWDARGLTGHKAVDHKNNAEDLEPEDVE